MSKRIRRAFTLIELLLVVAIIGILAGIAVFNFSGMQTRGKIAKAKSELRMLQTAVENYYVHHAAYPESLDMVTSATPRIVKTLPADTFSPENAPYQYTRGGAGNSYYAIYSVGTGGEATANIINDEVVESDPSCIYVSNAGEDQTP